MRDYFDAFVVFALGGLLVNPRNYRTTGRALAAMFAASAASATAYLVVVRPLLDWMGVFR